MSIAEASTELIPVLDLQPLFEGDSADVRNLTSELRQALEEVGFFSIVNHGVPWGAV